MLLRQIVRINEAAIVANSVHFGLMADPDTNLRLCQGFVFNYNKEQPKTSTLGVLDVLRNSYHSSNQPNIHLMVQPFGRGKSHFAVVLANYFSKASDSPEVAGILHQVENTSGASAIGERLRSFKKAGRHLVICLSGDRAGDLRKQFLQALTEVLEREGITDTIAQLLCQGPLTYLQKLPPQQRRQAEDFLEQENSEEDLLVLQQQLQKHNPSVIPKLKQLAKHITGFIPDWSSEVDLEEILRDLIQKLCSGENRRFQGILILFDELFYYLQNWARDPVGAGRTALQNITNICQAHPGHIALLSFSQFDLSSDRGIAPTSIEDYKKIATRVAPKDATYKPISSLELVMDEILIQEPGSDWDTFRQSWDSTLLAETRHAYEEWVPTYRQKGYSKDWFHKHLTLGCFPLHPLTTYLLCNLAFTQDRTALQFIKKQVKDFVDNQPVEKNNHLNFVYPIQLLETFLEDFSGHRSYEKYREALNSVTGSNNPDELAVFQAVFLYHASERFTKADNIPHEEILAGLAGISTDRTKKALERLVQARDVVRYKPEIKTYDFWQGASPTDLARDLEAYLSRKGLSPSLNALVNECQANIAKYLPHQNQTLVARSFVESNKLVDADWQFECKIYTIDGLQRALSSDQTLRNTLERGILAYILANSPAELNGLRRTIVEDLVKSKIGDRVAVAIPNQDVGDLPLIWLKLQTLKEKDFKESANVRSAGAAYDDLIKSLEDQLTKQLTQLLQNCTYYCREADHIPAADRNSQQVISALLEKLYPWVPPVESIEKLRSNHRAGRTVIGYVACKLLADDLTSPWPNNTYSFVEQVFINSWRLLKKSGKRYEPQKPGNPRIQQAWDRISQLADLGQHTEKTIALKIIWQELSSPPYGYSKSTFTVLLAAWLAHHRREVSLKGTVLVPNADKKKGLTRVETRSLKEWANMIAEPDKPNTVFLYKPDEFVDEWIVEQGAQLIRRKQVLPPTPPQGAIGYDRAIQYLQEAETFLEQADPELPDVQEVDQLVAHIKGKVAQVEQWFQPVEDLNQLSPHPPLEDLLRLYPALSKKPPISLPSNSVTVQPTQQQRDQHSQAWQTVRDWLVQQVNQKCEAVETLKTERDCGAYETEIDRWIAQMGSLENLPSHLLEQLHGAKAAIEGRMRAITEQIQLEQLIKRIEVIYDNLSDLAKQSDYQQALEEIERLANQVPLLKGTEQYTALVQSIGEEQDDLLCQIGEWEGRYAPTISKEEASKLKDDINRKFDRYTEESSTQRLRGLLTSLDNIILERQTEEKGEEELKAVLDRARAKRMDIKNIKGFPDAFQTYLDLTQIQLPAAKSPSLSDKQQELQTLKAEGYEEIGKRLSFVCESCKRKLDSKQVYDTLKNALQKSLSLISTSHDFNEFQVSLKEAEQQLEKQYQALVKRQEDNQKLQEIRQHIPAKADTLVRCQEAIAEIETLRQQLHDPNAHRAEIDQRLQEFQNKLAEHTGKLQSLKQRLETVDNIPTLTRLRDEYHRLDMIFQGSSKYPAYEELQQHIRLLSDDLNRLQEIEANCQQSQSLAACDQALEVLANIPNTLNNLERFTTRLQQIETQLTQKQQSYLTDLENLQNRLASIQTLEEAKQFQRELTNLSGRYHGSTAQSDYEHIQQDAHLLVTFLTLVSPQLPKTLENCVEEQNKLRNWQDRQEISTSSIASRLKAHLERLDQQETTLREQRASAAQAWLKEIETATSQMMNLSNDEERLKQASRLLSDMTRHRQQYCDYFSESDQLALANFEQQCRNEQERNEENQIISRFKNLPRDRRVALHQQMSHYLTDATEEFYG